MDQQHRAVRAKYGAQILGCGESTFWHYHASDPTFPRARKITTRLTVWDEGELIAWRDARMVEPAAKVAA